MTSDQWSLPFHWLWGSRPWETNPLYPYVLPRVTKKERLLSGVTIKLKTALDVGSVRPMNVYMFC